jgi:NCAIR mutase (PurE)-related protein
MTATRRTAPDEHGDGGGRPKADRDGEHGMNTGDDALERLLADVAAGRVTPGSARDELERLGIALVGDFARLDLGRRARTGVPEIVYAAGKTSEQLVAVAAAFVRRSGAVLCSAATPQQADAVAAAGLGELNYDARSRVLTVHGAGYSPPEPRGAVGVLAAGTSDMGPAEEAAAVAREMGVTVITAYDVGVAGLHRLSGPLEQMLTAGVAALVVAAGMEGALPSVVAGLVSVPVIAVPTSIGYGASFGGLAALLGMLNSCANGVSVVNIDNGFGAGCMASLINHLP